MQTKTKSAFIRLSTICEFVFLSRLAIAQAGYISVDSSIYYMDFKSRNYKHLISFPFTLHFGLYADPRGNLYGHTLLTDGPYLVRVDLSDTTHTLIHQHRGSISFANDNLFYSTSFGGLRLYDINTVGGV